ncbi:TetR/AcrR family transcriptional regulator [Antarcticirhabdus aurantiaca]|uniref:TetR/AcrR family transcriptional regulator n=1 Tax=Antarcticirhabdus aurantiaca TaxID=2606717 RepID=A0ACD4NN91_9HYPH|nr:TetR/AcrR family transcriptional regulator [Antarcticirhabdus aurantiaca]WAJ28332.1 TetR/AcrR family transcriptional regulator [Jeongeuplla avenae]
MTEKQIDRRGALRERILAAAEARIVSSGASALRARDVMADAGAALGGLYNAFEDLDDVVIHVNSRTLGRLQAALTRASQGLENPTEALRAAALAYLAFAQANRSLWSALFEYRYASGRRMPDWHLAEQAELLVHIVEPLRGLRPDWDRDTLLLRARTLFGAIHGIVSTSMEERFVGLSAEGLASEIGAFVDVIVAGTVVPAGRPIS